MLLGLGLSSCLLVLANNTSELGKRVFIHAEMQHCRHPIARHAMRLTRRAGHALALVHHPEAIHRVALHVELAMLFDQESCRFLRQLYLSRQDHT